MRSVTISDYIRALENPAGVFRTLGEVEAERDIYRDIALRSGNSAVVFTYMRDNGRRFLKCYIRPNSRLREIYPYIENHRPSLLPEVRLLRDELYVDTLSGTAGWVDVVEGVWAEGETLDAAITRAGRNTDSVSFSGLAGMFDDLCRSLLAQEWAHGDLKPENIIVRSDGSLALIDCDAMWIPEFAGRHAVELGTPGYRHPGRNASHFDKRIDDYSMLLISVGLHAFALCADLYGKYNTSDLLVMSPVDIVGGSSAAYAEIVELFAVKGMAREYRMAEALSSPSPGIGNIDIFFREPASGHADGLTSFVENGKWGFKDGSGFTAIAPFWDEVLEFKHGSAAARLGEWWHVIDLSGKVVAAGLFYEEICRLRKK